MQRLLEDVRRITRIHSSSPHGNEELVNYLVANIRESGVKVDLQPVMHSNETISKRQFNLVAVLGDPLVEKKIRKGLLLLSHLDTVEPGLAHHWTETGGNPFAAVEKNGRIYGLGVADSKVDFLCKLAALKQFIGKKIRSPIYLVGTCGAEYGMFGCRYLLQSLTVNPKYVLVGMPTELKLVTEHRSVHEVQLSIEYQVVEKDARGFNRRVHLESFGRNAHNAEPSQGDNAILKLIHFLRKACDSGFEMRLAGFTGHGITNQIPDHAAVDFYLTAHQFEDFKGFFRELIADDQSFKMELGGLGDIGISFLPENVFNCKLDVIELFEEAAQQHSSSTLSLSQIRQSKGKLVLCFDFRSESEEVTQTVLKDIQTKIQKLWSRYPALNLNVRSELRSPGLRAPADDPWTQICQAAMETAQIPPEKSSFTLGSEAGFFQKKGFDALVFGPGKGAGNSHSPNESVSVLEIEKAVQFYCRVIEKVCL